LRHAEAQPRLRGEPLELLGLLDRDRERLVADHVEALLERELRGAVVDVVGRDDRDGVDASFGRQLRLGLEHLLPGPVDAFRIEPELGARLPALRRVARERARDQLEAPVHREADPVDRADERAGSAADHPHAQLAGGLRRGSGHHRSSSFECATTRDGRA
jgi:hypothetical protein